MPFICTSEMAINLQAIVHLRLVVETVPQGPTPHLIIALSDGSFVDTYGKTSEILLQMVQADVSPQYQHAWFADRMAGLLQYCQDRKEDCINNPSLSPLIADAYQSLIGIITRNLEFQI